MVDKKPSQKQIDFATAIAETIGDDLPSEFTSSAYHHFIDDNIDYFYKIQGEIRYKRNKDETMFHLEHSYVNNDGYNGDTELNINPAVR